MNEFATIFQRVIEVIQNIRKRVTRIYWVVYFYFMAIKHAYCFVQFRMHRVKTDKVNECTESLKEDHSDSFMLQFTYWFTKLTNTMTGHYTEFYKYIMFQSKIIKNCSKMHS